jgi:hypothetical protein
MPSISFFKTCRRYLYFSAEDAHAKDTLSPPLCFQKEVSAKLGD